MLWNPGLLAAKYNFVHIHRSLGTIGGTSEEDSDYACIDRSTHSITGYLQSPDKNKQVKDKDLTNHRVSLQ